MKVDIREKGDTPMGHTYQQKNIFVPPLVGEGVVPVR